MAGSSKLPADMQDLEGRSLLRLIQNPETAQWDERELFVHVGCWSSKHPGQSMLEGEAFQQHRAIAFREQHRAL